MEAQPIRQANIIEIADFAAPELDVYARLTERQLLHPEDNSDGLFIAESPKVIKVALDEGCEPLAMLMAERHIEGDARELIARCGDIPIYTGEVSLLSELAGYLLTRGVLCAMRRPKPRSVEEVCEDARRIVVLDNVVDNTNVGAIFRSAAAQMARFSLRP